MTVVKRRAGFTLVEMLVALLVFAALIAVAMTLFTSQVRAFTSGNDRSDVMLAGEFATSTLTRELRTAGTNTVARQPWLVYAGVDVIAFHADMVSRVADPFAVYVDLRPATNDGDVSRQLVLRIGGRPVARGAGHLLFRS
jgi:prepilin-type N-terminal cleavage/methylation domain-containing protein